MSRKPVIGLTPYIADEKGSGCVRSSYGEAIMRAGGIPVTLAPYVPVTDIEAIADSLDGILFTGGSDVAPSYYGENYQEYCGEVSPPRDMLELPLIRYCLEKDVPFMGICRGMQAINVACGGSLYQDLKAQGATDFKHSHGAAGGLVPIHTVSFTKGGFLEEVLGMDSMSVNSWHHQAVKEVGKGLVVTATSFDGLVEGIAYPGKKCAFGVQWHPEKMPGSPAEPLFKYFVDKCRK